MKTFKEITKLIGLWILIIIIFCTLNELINGL